LSAHVPHLFSLQEKLEQKQFGEVLLDFRYLKTPELCEHRIESSPELIARDAEVWEAHGRIVCRVFALFEAVYTYIKDFAKCVSDLRDGLYIQQTVESVLEHDEGKQLMCEALYLYGVLLILLDVKIEGSVRERIVITYYRHKGQASIESIDDICTLVKATGYSHTVTDRYGLPRRPPGYPEEYFCRFIRKLGIDSSVISMMIARLRSEDMYSLIPSYPMPQHRSTALATQAKMLYILLYFEPIILEEHYHTMREIVDKHFSDNWVVAFYMGCVIELPHVWDGYKAAKAALANTCQPASIKSLYDSNLKMLVSARQQLAHHLTEGVLTQEYVLEKTSDLLHCARECNVCVRWLLLHRTSRFRKVPADEPQREAEAVLLLLLNTAQYEYLLKKRFSSLLTEKDKMWDAAKTSVVAHLQELADFFAGTNTFSRVSKDEQLRTWFTGLVDQVQHLEPGDSTIAGRKMHHLIAALKEVEQFHQIEASLQIKQYLAEIRDLLYRMIRVVNVRDHVLVTLSIVSDMSYAWDTMSEYTQLMRQRVQRDPFSVLKLRATFLKLVSILDSPLVRINQANSPDLESVSQYYSAEVASYMRRVLQVIPENLFSVLNEIIELQAHSLQEIPVKVPRLELKDWAQLDHRHRLARATHRISVLTEGVLTMQTTLLGVVQVDPKELLRDGIRKELVRQLTSMLQASSNVKPSKAADLEAALCRLVVKLDGFQLALEYVSDYVKINGLQLFREEFANLINFYVEQEHNAFLKKKVHSWQSTFKLAAASVNNAPPAAFSNSFFGRLVRELAHWTSPRRAFYSNELRCWIDPSGKEVIGYRMLSLLRRTLGHVGLRGLDSTFGFLVTAQLHRFANFYRQSVPVEQFAQLERYAQALSPTATLPEKLSKHYAAATLTFSKLLGEVAVTVSRCGSSKLLRHAMTRALKDSSLVDTSLLHQALLAADQSLVTEAQESFLKVGTLTEPKLPPSPFDDLLGTVSQYVDAAGLRGALGQVFISDDVLPHLPLVLAFFTVQQLARMFHNETVGLLTTMGRSLPDDAIDGVPLAVGIHCLLEQGHSVLFDEYINYMLQYLRSLVCYREVKSADTPEVNVVLEFMRIFCDWSRYDCPELIEFLQ